MRISFYNRTKRIDNVTYVPTGCTALFSAKLGTLGFVGPSESQFSKTMAPLLRGFGLTLDDVGGPPGAGSGKR